jgi:hypothetical protein
MTIYSLAPLQIRLVNATVLDNAIRSGALHSAIRAIGGAKLALLIHFLRAIHKLIRFSIFAMRMHNNI